VTYSHKRITVTLTNAQANGAGPAEGGFDFDGLRVHARIKKAGGVSFASAEITIYGLSLDHISALSTWGTNYHPNKNYIIAVEAGDPVNGMSRVFEGVVNQAWADFTNMPDVPMTLMAQGTSAPMNVGTVNPTSTSGPTQVAPVIQKLAQAGGMQFENSGVNAVLDGIYHWGSPWKQAKEIADAANVNIYQDDGTVAIWPKDQPRQGDVLEVSPQTGLRDYPSFTQFGVLVKVEFKRTIQYGTLMHVTSDLKEACGNWSIYSIDYDLQSETPNGNWFAILNGIQLGAPVTGVTGT
jgi:hypothetical protein